MGKSTPTGLAESTSVFRLAQPPVFAYCSAEAWKHTRTTCQVSMRTVESLVPVSEVNCLYGQLRLMMANPV